jgi:hypothetical protein
MGSPTRALHAHRKKASVLALLVLTSAMVVRTYEDQGIGYQPDENQVRRDHTGLASPAGHAAVDLTLGFALLHVVAPVVF